MKTLRLVLLIVVLAVITFLLIKSVEQHYHVVHKEKTTIPVAQK